MKNGNSIVILIIINSNSLACLWVVLACVENRLAKPMVERRWIGIDCPLSSGSRCTSGLRRLAISFFLLSTCSTTGFPAASRARGHANGWPQFHAHRFPFSCLHLARCRNWLALVRIEAVGIQAAGSVLANSVFGLSIYRAKLSFKSAWRIQLKVYLIDCL